MEYFHLTYCTMFTKWLKVRMSDYRSGQRRFWIKQDFICLFFFMYVHILWQGQKAVLTEFEFVDIFYSKFQLVLSFPICNKFCVENWLLCCDLSYKCRSGWKRFWKRALHLLDTVYMIQWERLILIAGCCKNAVKIDSVNLVKVEALLLPPFKVTCPPVGNS